MERLAARVGADVRQLSLLMSLTLWTHRHLGLCEALIVERGGEDEPETSGVVD